MTDLRPGAILMVAFRFLFLKRQMLFRTCWLPVFALLVISYALRLTEGQALVAVFALLYMASHIGFTWVSRSLLGPTGRAHNEGGYMAVDGAVRGAGLAFRRLFAFQWRLCLMGLIIYIAGRGIEDFVLADRSGGYPNLYYYVLTIIVLLSPLLGRLALMLPAAAIGHRDSGMLDAWRLTAGHTRDLASLVVILIGVNLVGKLVPDAMTALAGLVAGPDAAAFWLVDLFAQVLMAITGYVIIALWACAGSVVYYRLSSDISDYAVVRPEFQAH